MARLRSSGVGLIARGMFGQPSPLHVFREMGLRLIEEFPLC